jgi:hypothetical protein
VNDFERFATGYYVNETDLFLSAERAHKAFAHKNWQRLQAIAQKYDADGTFTTFPSVS